MFTLMKPLNRRDILLGSATLLAACAKKSSVIEGRTVAAVYDSQPTTDGAGVSLQRALGHNALRILDPFLMLDEFQSDNPSDYLAGFPSHPHRGFETVTYMVQGAMEHQDSVGNKGRLTPGSAQWMTAGHGIVHSEMPKQESGLMWGYQLWVNLPAARKMIPPRYQDIPPAQIPEVELEKGRMRVMAGTANGKTGPVSGIDVDPLFLDLRLDNGAHEVVTVPTNHNAFAYVMQGSLKLGGREVRSGQLAVLSPGEAVTLEGLGGRALLLAGRPLNEPVSRWGPFVMNTDAEIRQAVDEYRNGTLTKIL
jgi:redox-sensitive bicupin YhaK (pirin superfamily)